MCYQALIFSLDNGLPHFLVKVELFAVLYSLGLDLAQHGSPSCRGSAV